MAFTTIPSAGSKLRGSTLSALITEARPLFAQKTAVTSRNTTITPTADPDLAVSVAASTVYYGKMMLIITSDANAAGDFLLGFSLPTGATLAVSAQALDTTLASGFTGTFMARATTFAASGNFPAGFGASTTATCAIIDLLLTMSTTAGSLVVTWAQASSSATNTNLGAGSYLMLEQAL